jgi:phosphomethylpyrimidine synthase
LVKGVKGARDWDLKMARARKVLDWDEQLSLAIDPELAKKKRRARNKSDETACSMCGDYCAVKIVGEYFDSPVYPCGD